ncbi:hypothetical protein CEP51_009626 [Fusarium floridanum]|uniref:Heterokaryon incompatibility domain-containing protein n=1 Tax=Fusarium floridanum TaxID=1325733 RepID=A0A428RGZ0_9HYPO|nr:hypothetical protein CEP51_009626 [Fusarium floridanum]
MPPSTLESKGADTLCQRCLRLTFDNSAIVDAPPPQRYEGRDDLDLDEYGIVHLDFTLEDELPDLLALERSGCHMCLFFKKVILTQLRLLPTEQNYTGRITLQFTEFHPDLGTVQFTDSRDDWLPNRIAGELRMGTEMYPIDVFAKHRTDGRYSPMPDPNPLSDQSIHRIKTYLDTCLGNQDTHHSECSYPGTIAAPLRLLNISDERMIRLEETNNQDIPYVILSYCWGPAKVVFDARTVLANLPERLQGLRTDTLPQTLQHSISLAHRLGASHIWIDALCIVQDSGEWIYESVRMMQYYEMAQYTIVPIDSSGAEKGFLSNRPPWAEDIIQWKGSFSHLQFYFPSFNSVEEAGPATSSPWASRGWTFQERLLSSRLVFIGRDEVKFRCRAGWGKHASQTPITLESLGSYFLPLSPTYAAHSNDWNNVDMIRDKWYQILSEYSQRSLTKQSDKLIALSGITSKINQLLGNHEKYLDGHWESDLWHGLTWRRVPVRGKPSWPTVKSDEFPSWSWCCMNQPLIWQDGTASVDDIRLVEVVRQGTGTDEKVKKLIVEGWIFPIKLLAAVPDDLEVDFYLDSLSDSSDDLVKQEGVRVVLLKAYLDGEDKNEWLKDPAAKPHDVCGLIIEPTGDSYEGHAMYRRLGIVDILPGWDFTFWSSEMTPGSLFYQGMYTKKETAVLV